MNDTTAESNKSAQNSKDVHNYTSQSRLACEVCGRRFSSRKASLQPMVGRCGHSFCKYCSSKLKGRCAMCRAEYNPVQNCTMIDALGAVAESRQKLKEISEKMASMKLQMIEAKLDTDSDDSDLSEKDEESAVGEESEDEYEENSEDINALEAANREREELRGLNDRLGNYIARVRQLEESNRKLQADMEALRIKWEKPPLVLPKRMKKYYHYMKRK